MDTQIFCWFLYCNSPRGVAHKQGQDGHNFLRQKAEVLALSFGSLSFSFTVLVFQFSARTLSVAWTLCSTSTGLGNLTVPVSSDPA
jgi:hypothetical protein